MPENGRSIMKTHEEEIFKYNKLFLITFAIQKFSECKSEQKTPKTYTIKEQGQLITTKTSRVS